MVVGAFTDQAYNLILMANDEARLLRSEVGHTRAPAARLDRGKGVRALQREFGIEDVVGPVDAGPPRAPLDKTQLSRRLAAREAQNPSPLTAPP